MRELMNLLSHIDNHSAPGGEEEFRQEQLAIRCEIGLTSIGGRKGVLAPN